MFNQTNGGYVHSTQASYNPNVDGTNIYGLVEGLIRRPLCGGHYRNTNKEAGSRGTRCEFLSTNANKDFAARGSTRRNDTDYQIATVTSSYSSGYSLTNVSIYNPRVDNIYHYCFGILRRCAMYGPNGQYVSNRYTACHYYSAFDHAKFTAIGSTWTGNIQQGATRMQSSSTTGQDVDYYYAISTPVYNNKVDSQMYGACAGILRRGWVGSTFITDDVQPGSRAINCSRFGTYALAAIHAAK